MARLAIFIDGAYLDRLCRDVFDVRLDYGRVSMAISDAVAAKTPESVDILRTFYYTCPPYQGNPPRAEDQTRYANYRRFSDALSRLPRFQLREGHLAMRGIGQDGRPQFEQKRVDLLLGLDFALLSSKRMITHIALVAGDSDLIAAVEVAKQESVSTWLFHGPKGSYHQDLWKVADERHEIDRAFTARCEVPPSTGR